MGSSPTRVTTAREASEPRTSAAPCRTYTSVTTAAPTRTSTNRGARLTAVRCGSRTVLAELSSAVPVGLYRLRSSTVDMAHIALMQTAAMLVTGDDVSLEVSVGAGAGLLLRELSATVAHPATVPARQRISIDVAPGGVLIILEQPLAIAAGASVHALDINKRRRPSSSIDTIVLGRHAERPVTRRLSASPATARPSWRRR